MGKARVLLVEDDPEIAGAIRRMLAEAGFEVVWVDSGEAALERAVRESFDVVLTDFQLGGLSGLDIIRQLRPQQPGLPVVLMTGFGTIDTAIEAMKLGAYDYVVKPLNGTELLPLLGTAAEAARRQRTSPSPTGAPDPSTLLVGISRGMQGVYKEIGRLAARPVPVLIRGETGTGKELVARAIWRHSDRAERPFIAVNCAALPDTLLESELFGHDRGAFTGAESRRQGRFELANGGTLFLDEIGDFSPTVQVKLLRVLQERTVQRLGSSEPIPVDVRILAATHRNLEEMMARQEFREDLYYRLAVALIRLPALRERREDIPLLINHFARRHGPELGNPNPAFLPDAVECLRHHPWPGNVRELENIVRKAILQAQGYPVTAAHVDAVSTEAVGRAFPANPTGGQTLQELVAEILRRAQAGLVHDAHSQVVREAERELLAQTMLRAAGNLSLAARWLGISRVTLRARLRQLGLREGPEDETS
ncbi:MAG: sigma-54-dependent Fis family transcriptional regulator, partial [Verrucomicrobia subdivision 3 bacterium]|nr:sigma-54-dependent Fis family transcriptional regulator [Limisphaerales bacterium]